MLDKLQGLRSLLPALWAQRWPALLAAVLSGVVLVGLAAIVPDKYEASARIFVDTQSILKPLMNGMTVTPNVEQQLGMMARTLISRPNVERAAREAGLTRDNMPDSEKDKAIELLLRDIRFATAGRENLYAITFRGNSAQSSLALVEALLAIFVESTDGEKKRDNAQARSFIESQIKIYEARLIQAENALKDFKLRNINAMPNLAQDYVARSNEVQKDLATARLELQQAENAREALSRRLKDEPATYSSSDPAAAGIPRVVPEIDQRIDATRKRLDDLLSRFTDEHPDVVGARRQLDQLIAERAAQDKARPAGATPIGTVQVPNKVYQDIKLSLAQTEAMVASLRAKVADGERRMAAARETAQTIPKVEAEFAQLNRDYDVNKKNYEQLLARRESAQISGSLDTSPGVGEFRTVDPPRVSPRPVWPNRPMLFGAALLLSIGVGLVFAYVRDMMAPVYRDARSLRLGTGIPLLGVVTQIVTPAQVKHERRDLLLFASASMMYLLFVMAVAGLVLLRQTHV